MKRRWILAALGLLLLAGYWYRVYGVNTSEVVQYAQPVTLNYSFNEAVELVPGYYNTGYADLSGYYIIVTGSHIVKTDDYLASAGFDDSFYEDNDVARKYQYLYIVDATFYFDGEGDPLEQAVDLTSFRLVGEDYYCNFSYEINGLGEINPILGENSMFSIGSGKTIELHLPFLVESGFPWGVSVDDLLADPPKLMVSEYPYEVYISLPAADTN